MQQTPLDADALWQFSLGHYRQPQVAETCLRLQHHHQLNINLLLLLLWLLQHRVALASDNLSQLVEAAAPLQQRYLSPLRHLRAQLKTDPTLTAEQSQSLKAVLLHAELQFERQQQQHLLQAVRLSYTAGDSAASQLNRYLTEYGGLQGQTLQDALAALQAHVCE